MVKVEFGATVSKEQRGASRRRSTRSDATHRGGHRQGGTARSGVPLTGSGTS